MLQLTGRTLYKDDDPAKFFFHGQVQSIDQEDNNYILNLNLPFVTKGDIELMRNNDELTIQVGNFRRNVILPNILKGLPVIGAKFEADRLKVKFARTEQQS